MCTAATLSVPSATAAYSDHLIASELSRIYAARLFLCHATVLLS